MYFRLLKIIKSKNVPDNHSLASKISSGFRFVSDVLLRNKIGASIKLKTCEIGSNFNSFDDSLSKLSIKFKSISPFFYTANTKKFSDVKILL